MEYVTGRHNIPYTIRRHRRAKRCIIRLQPDSSVTITLPYRAPLQEAHTFIEEKESWLHKQRTKQERHKTPGNTLTIFGIQYHIEEDRTRPSRSIWFSGDTVYSNGIPDMKTKEQFYRKYARRYFLKRVPIVANTMSVRYGRISIRGQKTRWASCSPEGNLSFNFRLLQAPREVIEYVIIHELAHTRYPNHSKAFWTLVEKHCPAYRERRKWLREHGSGLFL